MHQHAPTACEPEVQLVLAPAFFLALGAFADFADLVVAFLMEAFAATFFFTAAALFGADFDDLDLDEALARFVEVFAAGIISPTEWATLAPAPSTASAPAATAAPIFLRTLFDFFFAIGCLSLGQVEGDLPIENGPTGGPYIHCNSY
jgi:hypothetical protein